MPVVEPLDEPMALATISAKSVREDLKPVVPELAMLLPMTSRFLLAALRPERPCWNPMVFFSCSAGCARIDKGEGSRS
ncbi:hypothetical protein D3C85_1590230 [compost metagenome]